VCPFGLASTVTVHRVAIQEIAKTRKISFPEIFDVRKDCWSTREAESCEWTTKFMLAFFKLRENTVFSGLSGP
jgi:hypothetical protein